VSLIACPIHAAGFSGDHRVARRLPTSVGIFRLTLHWIQASWDVVSKVFTAFCTANMPSARLAIHYAPDSALRCCCGHIKPRSAASASGTGFRRLWRALKQLFHEVLARCSRFWRWRGSTPRSGRGTRRGALADRAGDLRCRVLVFFHNTILSRRQSALNVCLKRNHHRRNRKSGGNASPRLRGFARSLYTEKVASWDPENALGYPANSRIRAEFIFDVSRPSVTCGNTRLWFGGGIQSAYRICLTRGRAGFPSRLICLHKSEWTRIMPPAGRGRQSCVAIDSLEDMERLFDGIPLKQFRPR